MRNVTKTKKKTRMNRNGFMRVPYMIDFNDTLITIFSTGKESVSAASFRLHWWNFIIFPRERDIYV